MDRLRRHWKIVLGLLAAAAAIVALCRPEPVPVEIAAAARGPLLVTVDEEGETRVPERFVVATPIDGRLLRIGVDEGDTLVAGEIVARIAPVPLDPRARGEAVERVRAAQASLDEALAGVAEAEAWLEEAVRDLERARELAEKDLIARRDLERAETAERVRSQALGAALSRSQVARHELRTARAALLQADPAESGGEGLVDVRAPVAGRVLRIFEEAERVVSAGAPIFEMGDLSTLEVVVDILSADAVSVGPGAPVLLTNWGAPDTLSGVVRMIEPSGFTKVSPLGVEEQRVNVVIDLVDPPAQLGDRFSVDVHIVVWESEDALKVPTGALFRRDSEWIVFVVDGGRARLQAVEIGRVSGLEAEVRGGLESGQQVVLHPPDRLEDGSRIAPLGEG